MPVITSRLSGVEESVHHSVNGRNQNGHEYIDMRNLNNSKIVAKNDHITQEDKIPDLYNPYENRNIQHPTSYFDTWVHLLKASLGTGILAMPNAFQNSGYIVGTIGTMLIGILCTYCIHILIKSSYKLCVRRKVSSLTYAGTVAAAFEEGPRATKKFASIAKNMTDIFLVLYQIGSSCIYVVFIAQNLKMIFDSLIFGGPTNDEYYQIYIVCLFLPLIAISFIRNLKLLAPFSSAAAFLSLTSFSIIVFCYVFREAPSLEGRDPIGTLQTIPIFFGTVLFAMEAIGVILPLENEMAQPRKFGTSFGVLNMAMVPITILYTVVGLLGYLKYGDVTKGSITLNLPAEILSQVVLLLLSFSMSISYALSNHVSFTIIWNFVNREAGKSEYSLKYEYILRFTIVVITFVLAYKLPNLEQLTSLIGALCLSVVGLAFPAVIYFLTFEREYRKLGYVRFILFCLSNLALIMIAIFALYLGVSKSISDIMHSTSE